MKSFPITLLFILSMSIMFCPAQSKIDDKVIKNELSWIQSLLDEHDKSINSHNYIFYCTGHHGIIWSLATLDSSKIHLYNGTTRNHIEHTGSIDTLFFIKNNIETIMWAFDSLANTAKLLTPLKNASYTPVYNEIYIIKDNMSVYNLNNAVSYTGPNCITFNHKLNKLKFLMYWLAAPSSRQYSPIPSDDNQ